MRSQAKFITCINEGVYTFYISVGTPYRVILETETKYHINDGRRVYAYPKELFIPTAEPKKQAGQYSFKEIITNIKPLDEYCYEGIKVRCLQDESIEIQGTSGTTFKFHPFNAFEKSKVNPVTTSKAFQALEEHKTIESASTGTKYKREGTVLQMQRKGTAEFMNCGTIASYEIDGHWYITEDNTN